MASSVLPTVGCSLASFSNDSTTLALNDVTATEDLRQSAENSVRIGASSSPAASSVSEPSDDVVQLDVSSRSPTSEVELGEVEQSSPTRVYTTETPINELSSSVGTQSSTSADHDSDWTLKPKTLRQKSPRQAGECGGSDEEGRSDIDGSPLSDDELEYVKRESYDIVGEDNEDLVELHIRSNIMVSRVLD